MTHLRVVQTATTPQYQGAVHPINWKQKYAGMEVSQLRRLKELESECSRLKKMYADLALEHHALKDVVAKKL
jgi:hypothetical protein